MLRTILEMMKLSLEHRNDIETTITNTNNCSFSYHLLIPILMLRTILEMMKLSLEHRNDIYHH
jgi:hypothetical protein